MARLPSTADARRSQIPDTSFIPGSTPALATGAVLQPADRGCIVDYLGTHQHLASDLHFEADGDGSLIIRSGAHRLREGRLDIPVPALIGGDALVRESYDDMAECFRIQVQVTNRRFGPLFGYHGAFTATYRSTAETGVPRRLRSLREEARV